MNRTRIVSLVAVAAAILVDLLLRPTDAPAWVFWIILAVALLVGAAVDKVLQRRSMADQ